MSENVVHLGKDELGDGNIMGKNRNSVQNLKRKGKSKHWYISFLESSQEPVKIAFASP